MSDRRTIILDEGQNLPPAEGWLYQDGAGWYDPASITEATEGETNDGV